MADSVSDIFSGSLTTRLAWSRVDSQEIGSVTDKNTVAGTYSIGDGSTAGNADVVWSDTRTIPAASIDAIDLLSLTTATLGVSVPQTIRQLRIVRVVNNESATGKKILVGCDASAANYAFAVGPGSEICAINNTDSWAVTNANNVLRIGNTGTASVSYTIFLIGTSVSAA
jgi:hypothetical protein